MVLPSTASLQRKRKIKTPPKTTIPLESKTLVRIDDNLNYFTKNRTKPTSSRDKINARYYTDVSYQNCLTSYAIAK